MRLKGPGEEPDAPVLKGYKKGNYFLRMPEAASRAAPIAARMVAIPTGDFRVTAPVSNKAGDGVAGTAAEVTGAFTVSCDTVTGAVVVTAVVAAETVLPILLWIQ
jgi:hypothetical protein